MKNVSKIMGPVALFVASAIWGIAFSAQSEGMKHLPPAFFNALRSVVGCLALFVISSIFSGDIRHFWRGWSDRTLLLGGLACGFCLVFASVSQQIGICYSSAGKSGFFTSLYIVFVPIIGALFFHRKTDWLLWIAVLLSLSGAYLLSTNSGKFTMGIGGWSLLACALFYSCHILVIDHFVSKVDCTRLSCLQFFWNAVFSFTASILLHETKSVTAAGIAGGMMPMLFCGVFSSGIAYTLQMVGQKYVHPVAATLLMCLESVFSAVGGWILLHERLSPRELCGCGIILISVILAQLPPSLFSRKKA